MSKVIVVTLYRRPKYTQMLLDSLSHAYGIEDYHVVFGCDYSPQHQDACVRNKTLAEEFNVCSKEVLWNNPKLGPEFNTKLVMETAFRRSDYVVHLEEDTAISKDALRFFEFCGEAFKDDPKVVSVCAYHRYTDPARHQQVYIEQPYSMEFCLGAFCFWGMGIWKNRWEATMGGYYPEYPSGLDFWITQHLQPGQGCYRAVLARTQCTGGEDAVHTPSEAWHKEHEFNALGAWDFDMPDPDPSVWNVI